MTRAGDRSRDRGENGDVASRPRRKLPYEPPRVLSDEAFEQISLTCTVKHGPPHDRNFT